jgi:hypothetical protein
VCSLVPDSCPGAASGRADQGVRRRRPLTSPGGRSRVSRRRRSSRNSAANSRRGGLNGTGRLDLLEDASCLACGDLLGDASGNQVAEHGVEPACDLGLRLTLDTPADVAVCGIVVMDASLSGVLAPDRSCGDQQRSLCRGFQNVGKTTGTPAPQTLLPEVIEFVSVKINLVSP